AYDDPDSYRARFQAMGQRIDLFDDEAVADTLLAQVQRAVLELDAAPDDPGARLPAREDDGSLRFQVAHSRLREVEALHDHLLAAFDASRASGQPLRPQDVVVMVPDIRQYAPLIQAVFARDEATRLPYVILDRPQRGEQPLLTALEWLLTLPDARCTSAELWDLLDVPAVSARFGLGADELPRLRRWFESAGARWGLDEHHRAHWGVPETLTQNTWRFALDRLLLGYAAGEDRHHDQVFAGTLPDGDLSPLEASALGPMSQVLAALAAWAACLREPRTTTAWLETLQDLLSAFMQASDDHEAWLLEQLRQTLAAWAEEAGAAGSAEAVLTLPVVREGWLARLDEASMSQRFLSGAIHVATLMPMRAIPFRLVCILGLNDGEFPRQRPPADFDLMSLKGQQRAGDRSRREDDRYLFLEALLSAREQLLLSWVGRSARSNQALPPSLLVAQLRDYLQAGWRPAGGDAVDVPAMLTIEHALQPFSERYAEPDGPPTYAQAWVAARAGCPPAANTALPLPAELAMPDLESLARWLRLPARQFYRDRLGIILGDGQTAVPEHEPFLVDGLSRHQSLQALLAALHEPDGEAALARVVRAQAGRGEWPLAGFAEQPRRALAEQAGQLWRASAAWRAAETEPALLLSWQGEVGGRQLQVEHVVTDIRRETDETQAGDGRRLWQFTASALHDSSRQLSRWHPLLMPWLRHVLLALCGHALPTRVVSPSGSVDWPALSREAASDWWHALLAAWLDGQGRALPVEAKTAFAWAMAEARRGESADDGRALEAAAAVYEGTGYRRQGGPSASDEAPLGWLWPDMQALADSGDFTRLAGTLYLPVVQASRKPRDSAGAGG
ncbi:MAG: exodeoxyribonuclease V subunit gamma, partial [Perlucidibaca sp.]